ncbi:similar to Saccharomyces cerevisiae YIR010W DSN1 Essential component of the MIND kinetochore complex (Mtw1p Including Nnf1p-Nsl1p-Dsn1p) [Maudiozyma saulgeensis]|uniref:Similar to Saccharomyces cerevisiae YIR010W DSN1 Essential component of the MIND kinetochore complex (Mtw1p Including Nnf1p-Nsl1p-Dsn1p) n=1 Tax=Maudiozyma saulgeensis TaxID=1789683 RepID=A0A1X7R6U3_9SACH|nr:similar to Saccharomyces cerevisiae YIR010W DSN1 Essential component of the MIND kinetochore complex (Mtw1p Including Nnf1p-Nsl1p-Dsn1p) [Kazachstania saulgeensis]
MSVDSVLNNDNGGVEKTNIPKKRMYPLRMETLPNLSDAKDINRNANIVTSTQNVPRRDSITSTKKDTPNRQNSSVPTADDFENDQDFRFKRHKLPKIKGTQSLGERLDNLQDMKRAKWIDNFDSSIRNTQEQSSKGRLKSADYRKNRNNNEIPSSQPNLNLDEVPYLGASQWQQQQQPMYYIPVPTSPMYPSQIPIGGLPAQYMNQPIPMIPNSSMQPFYSSQSIPGSSQLLPPPQLNPINLQYTQTTRNSRKSLAEQRGRRLSIMSNREQMMISPHRDVPESQFYRYLGNVQGDSQSQLKQLYSWCAIRSFEKMRHDLKGQEKFSEGLPSNFIENKNITLSIIKNFVDDLRRGQLDIDWNAEDRSNIGRYKEEPLILHNNEPEDAEDTILKNLFKDDDYDEEGEETQENDNDREFNDDTEENSDSKSESFYYTGINIKRIPKSKNKRSDKLNTQRTEQSRYHNELKKKDIPLLPNSKNIKNEQNLLILTEKIEKLKNELHDWITVLDNNDLEKDIQEKINPIDIQVEREPIQKELEIDSSLHHLLSTEDLEKDLISRMNKLQVHTHLIKSHSKTLSKTTTKKIKLLTNEFKKREKSKENTINSKQLLRGLSDTLIKL